MDVSFIGVRSSGEINIKHLNKKLLVLNQPTASGMRQSLSYLRVEDWESIEVKTMQDFVRALLTHRPSFVMVESYFSSARLNYLVRAVRQTYPFFLIGYTDLNSAQEFQRLSEMDCDQVVYPPLSGPQIERILMKIQKNLETPSTNAPSSDMIHLRGRRGRPLPGAAPAPDKELDQLLSTMMQEVEQLKIVPAESKNQHQHSDTNEGKKVTETLFQCLQSLRRENPWIDENAQALDIVPLGDVTRIACIELESWLIAERLVAVFGTSGPVDDSFFYKIQEELVGLTSSQLPDCTMSSMVFCDVVKLPFSDWISTCGIYSEKKVFDQQEVGFGIFSHVDIIKLKEEGDIKAVSVELSDLDPAFPLPFRTFLNLPLNKKFLLYSHEKTKFEKWRAERLQNKGVQSVQLRRDEVSLVQQFQIEKFIQSQITSYLGRIKISS